MLNSSLLVVKLSITAAMLVLHIATTAPVLAKPGTSTFTWPQACKTLKYRPTEAEYSWRVKDKLHQMVSDRDIYSLHKVLRKDMLKANKAVPVPYLFNASGVAAPGYNEYDPGLVYAKRVMERQGEEVVRLLIWAGANPDEKGKHDMTALIRAAFYSRSIPKVSPQIVKRLLDAGANPNLRDVNGWTALMFAAENGSHDIVALLLKHKARTDFKNCAGQTAADIAAAKGHKLLAKRLRALP
jgi:hypothetical protein